MKTIGIRQAKAGLSQYVAYAQRGRVVIMKHGKPVAILFGVAGYDWEDVLWATDKRLIRSILRSRKHDRTFSDDEAAAMMGLPSRRQTRRPQSAAFRRERNTASR